LESEQETSTSCGQHTPGDAQNYSRSDNRDVAAKGS